MNAGMSRSDAQELIADLLRARAASFGNTPDEATYRANYARYLTVENKLIAALTAALEQTKKPVVLTSQELGRALRQIDEPAASGKAYDAVFNSHERQREIIRILWPNADFGTAGTSLRAEIETIIQGAGHAPA